MTETTEDKFKGLADTLGQVSTVDTGTGRQSGAAAVLVSIVVLCVILAGVGIALVVSRRQAAKAKYEAYTAKEAAKRQQAEAQLAEEADKRVELLQEADRLGELATAKEKEAADSRKAYDDLVEKLSAATSWDDIQVR